MRASELWFAFYCGLFCRFCVVLCDHRDASGDVWGVVEERGMRVVRVVGGCGRFYAWWMSAWVWCVCGIIILNVRVGVGTIRYDMI